MQEDLGQFELFKNKQKKRELFNLTFFFVLQFPWDSQMSLIIYYSIEHLVQNSPYFPRPPIFTRLTFLAHMDNGR